MAERLTRRDVLGGMAAGTVVLAGCLTGDDTEESTGGDETDDDGTGGGNGVHPAESITLGVPNDPTEGRWDVYGGVTPSHTRVFEPLVGTTDDLETEPLLATDWEATDDRTWVFDLREDVTFHSGESLAAAHVVETFEALLEYWDQAPGWIDLEPENVTEIDEHSVEFVTNEPFPTFPGTISHNWFGIFEPDSVREDAIGTGPFQVEKIDDGSVTLGPYEDYRDGAPALEDLTLRHLEDPSTRILSLRNEELDLALDPPRNEVSELDDDEETATSRQLTPRAGFAAVNLYQSPTDDEDLRRALAFAVDQTQLVETVLEGIGEPARGPISRTIPWAIHDELPAMGPDRDRAADLVEESTYDGETLEILINGSDPDDRSVAEVLQNWFGDIGVESEIRSVEPAAFYEVFREGESNVSLVNFGSNSAASDYLIRAMFHSMGTDNRPLYESEGTGIMNPGSEVDELIDDGYQADSLADKREHYGEVQKRVVETGAAIALYYEEYVLARHSDIQPPTLHPIVNMSDWRGLERQGDD